MGSRAGGRSRAAGRGLIVAPGTVTDHPERVMACQRGEHAGRMVSAACELACLVRDAGREAAGEFIAALAPEEVTALLVVQAAMIPVDVPAAALLSWVTWDEYGRPLPGPVLEAPAPGRRSVTLQPCGTYAAFRRHEDRGELIDDDCRAAAKAYWADRYRRRKSTAAKRRAPVNGGKGRGIVLRAA
jgi:hypothetical protein